MRIETGSGGWARLTDVGLPGPLYVRFGRDARGRRIVTELYADGRGKPLWGEVLGATVSDDEPETPLRIREIEASVTGDAEFDSFLDSLSHLKGPDLSRLASHFSVQWWGDRDDHWVAESWRAQMGYPGVSQAPMGRDNEGEGGTVEAPPPVEPPVNGLTDDFLHTVAANYFYAVAKGEHPAPFIRAQVQTYGIDAVRAWIKKARARGILPEAKKRGAAG
jgi:hypothetical protein